ncbi:hypothetical protein Dip510_000171 [Elusimicrobium posterum]|uniref:hypothetical protein n=1 Tax=Elusimicrobium posterum TaxID=3116653 RepID=UPI003C761DDE
MSTELPVNNEADILQGTFACFAENLPALQEDVLEKLTNTFAGKKTVENIQADIERIKKELVYKIPQADDFTAQVMLDKITAPAAALALRIIKNKEALIKFRNALGFDNKTFNILVNFYAAHASAMFFDEEMAKALSACGYKCGTDIDAAQRAIQMLEEKTSTITDYAKDNQQTIEEYAIKYNIPYKPVKLLIDTYAREGAVEFKKTFDETFAVLKEITDNENLISFLSVKFMLGVITQQDAQNMAVLHKEMGYNITEEDIFVIACRYLRTKTPKEVAATLDALLKSLPYNIIKEENLGLALTVLTEGSADSLDTAREKAQILKNRSAFRRILSKYDCFDGFTYEIAKRFSGRCSSDELLFHFNQLLNKMPFCSNINENNDLVCKVLLDKITEEAAIEQALYRRDLKAKTLTEGLAPEVLKNYLGTKAPEDIISYFEETLQDYSFWKSSQDKHRFALEALVANLNGTSSSNITDFALEMLEKGEPVKPLSVFIAKIPQREKLKLSAQELKTSFKKALDTAEEEQPQQTLDMIFD